MRLYHTRTLHEILLAPPLSARAKVGPILCITLFSVSRLLSPQSRVANVTLVVSAASATFVDMSQRPALTSEKTWKDLKDYYDKSGKCLVIKELFEKDPDRFKKFR